MGQHSLGQRLPYVLPLPSPQGDLLPTGEAHAIPRASTWNKQRAKGVGLVGSRPDTAGGRLCQAFAEPRVPGMVALCLTDGAPAAPCQEGGPGAFPLLDGEKPQ